jgi:hypothetical protein
MSNAASTHRDLWGGIDLKVASARFHLDRMVKTLQPPEPTAHLVALEAAGAIIGGMWHEAFYAHLDAFLSTARSVSELIQCCFGVDRRVKEMREWFRTLDADEQARRREFERKFQANYDAFRALPLGTARHISEHRTGAPPVTVTVTGLFGLTYSGSPTKPIPTSEAREMPPELPFMQRHTPVRPMWNDFQIDGKPLFETFHSYLESAQALITRARALADEIHGENELTFPPDKLS